MLRTDYQKNPPKELLYENTMYLYFLYVPLLP